MKVGYVQFAPKFGAVPRNLAKAINLVRQSERADLWVFPELFCTGYSFRNKEELLSLAEPCNGPTIDTMLNWAHKLGCWFCAGFPELDQDLEKVYNSAFLVGPNGTVHIYRKCHLFYQEKELFTPGNTGFGVVDIGQARVGMMICFDWLFPESCRTLAVLGAQIVCHPSNLVLPHCPSAMPIRALENHIFTITANRIGTEHRKGMQPVHFIGSSMICAPDGSTLAKADLQEGTKVVELDPSLADNKMITPLNNIFRDLRPECYLYER